MQSVVDNTTQLLDRVPRKSDGEPEDAGKNLTREIALMNANEEQSPIGEYSRHSNSHEDSGKNLARE